VVGADRYRVTVAHGPNEHLDPGIRLVLEELRDLRREMRDDRRQAQADRRQADADRRRSDERFEQLLQEFREDSARRELATQKAFRDVRAVGLAIVKTLNRHTRILERIDRKLTVPRSGGRGRSNGRGA
jgi:DNA polymerase III epsilon subunit-like protein